MFFITVPLSQNRNRILNTEQQHAKPQQVNGDGDDGSGDGNKIVGMGTKYFILSSSSLDLTGSLDRDGLTC